MIFNNRGNMMNEKISHTTKNLTRILITMIIAGLMSNINVQAEPEKYRVYFGTATTKAGEGIYQSILDMATGQLSEPRLAGEAIRPGFLEIHPKGTHLYAAGEHAGFKGKSKGALIAFSIDKLTGNLTPLNSQSTKGEGPCHIFIDYEGRNILVSNYRAGSCAVVPIASDGTLKPASSFHQHIGSSIHPKRQATPHAHSINLDPEGKYAMVADLGLDQILIYKYDSKSGTLTPNDPAFVRVKPGGGPRHLVFHPSSKFVYECNEMSSTVTAFQYDSNKGIMSEIQMISTVPKEFEGNNSTAEIRIAPDGEYLYVSNRGHNSIAIFKIDQSNGKLTALGNESTRGDTPRNFNIEPTGTYLVVANQNSNNITVFKIDKKSGLLKFTGSDIEVPKPRCVRFYGL